MAINVKNKLVTLESLGVAYSAEQDAREEADQALSTRIDNIVAPEGDPSLTEVSDARVSGSTTYNTLKARLDADKAAIGTEISQLSADLGALTLIVPEYDSSVAYGTEAYVMHNGILYKRKSITESAVAEQWTSGHWIAVSSLAVDITDKANVTTIAKIYDPSQAYNTGNYIVKSNKIYRAKTDIPAETWTPGHWYDCGTVSDYISTVISQLNAVQSNLQSQIDVINAPEPTTALINAKSWDIKVQRFEHVAYSEKLFSGETLTKQTAQMIEKSFVVRYHNNPYSIHFKTNTTADSTEIRITVPTAFTLNGTQEIDIPLYISDAENVTSVRFRTSGSVMSKEGDISPVTGWNMFRFFTEGSGFDGTVSTTLIRFFVYHSVRTDIDVYIGSILQVTPDKGNLIIIDDGPYYSFYTNAYPGLQQLGVPVTWAIDPMMLDANDAPTRKLINENELASLAVDGLSEFSFHSYDLTIMSTATAGQALADTLNNIRYLRKNGLNPERIWRAAWLNNACADPSLANLELDASASYEGKSGIAVYPFRDKYNIPRYGLGGRTTEDIDVIFEKLRTEHCTYLLYLHGVSTADRDTNPTLWAYFMSKLEIAISDGYVNPTTYNRLVAHYKQIS